MPLEYFLILEMAGKFPGSPDRDRVQISEADHDQLFDRYIRPPGRPVPPEEGRETRQTFPGISQ